MKIFVFIFLFCFQQNALSSICYHHKKLYCFDSTEKSIGEILVMQCWSWLRFSCQPCKANLNHSKIGFSEYVNDCHRLYPESKFVLKYDNLYDEIVNEYLTNKFKG
jgi:hypothetical protein